MRHVGKTPCWDMDIPSPGLDSKKWFWNSVYLPTWMFPLWWTTQDFDLLRTFWLGLCPSGSEEPVDIVLGRLTGQRGVETSLAEVWVLVKKSLVIKLQHLSDDVKMTFLLVRGRRFKCGLGDWQCVRWEPLACPFFILYVWSIHTVMLSSFWIYSCQYHTVVWWKCGEILKILVMFQ